MFYELSLNLLFFLVQLNILYEILEFSFNIRLDIKRDFLRVFTTIVIWLNVILYYRKLAMMVIASVFVLIILSIQDYKYWRDYWKKIVLYAVYFTLIHIVVFVINCMTIDSFYYLYIVIIEYALLKIIIYIKSEKYNSYECFSFVITSVIVMFSVFFIDTKIINQSQEKIILFILLLFSYFIFYLLHKKELRKNDISLLNDNLKSYRRQLDDIKKSNSYLKSVKHDLNNHLLIIKKLVGDNDKLKQYLNNIDAIVDCNNSYLDTGNLEIDMIINSKLSIMKENDIDFNYEVIIPNDLNINSFDFVIILANLLDNAITASIECEKPAIDIIIRYQIGLIYIEVKNSCVISNDFTYDLLKESDLHFFKSSKKNSFEHGIGLKNVYYTVKKYNGSMSVERYSDKFTTRIYMEDI
ncbi:sensor histidine kinase [Lachnospira multipara]|uniref:sensor histidine kinase n=1 Tax=Lachnospira multipara TaxID=28051 RepID=UPI0004085880|nr:GHKL domain-containing protein [Lachnospira multipara]